MIPKIDVQAAYHPYDSITYTYEGYPYWFSPTTSSSVAELDGYTIDNSVFEFVIKNGADALKISLANNLFGIKITEFTENYCNWIYSLFYNARVALGKVFADWWLGSSISACYAWQMYLLDIDDNYPGHETYGPAYGWRFEGIFGENTDIVLDQYGQFYGSNENPIGNYTFVDTSDETDWISVHQTNPSEDFIYIPNTNITQTFNDLDIPYIQGTDLYFTIHYQNGNKSQFRVNNFVDTYISCNYADFQSYPILKFWSPSATSDSYYTIDNLGSGGYREKGYMQNDASKSHVLYISFYQNGVKGFNLPNYYRGAYGNSWPTSLTVNCKGLYDFSYLQGSFPALYLGKKSYIPVSDPVEVPVDVPVPFDDIPDDPTDFEPDPSQDPDPVPGSDYPDPEPQPVPVPPIPPIVSGNDDLWPDVNDLIAAEDSLGEYTFAIRNFEWPDFSNLMGDYLSPLIWVSTIISTLFNGSAYSIIFSVLSLMFVVAALLGILKGWTSRDG